MPALVLLPTAGLLLLLEWFRRIRAGEGKSLKLLLAFIPWVALVAVTFVGLWPAMWVAPINILSRIVDEMRVYAAGHELPNFFLGHNTDDPGPLFYPVAYLFRATPASLIGLVAAAVLGWRRRPPLDAPVRRWSTLGLVAFAVLFAVVMTQSAKKFDRYLSPRLWPLISWPRWAGWDWCRRLWGGGYERRSGGSPAVSSPTPSSLGRLSGWVVLAALLLLHGVFALAHYPYYLTYYNPLVGGSRTAAAYLMTGWGEGLDAVAAWINQQPGTANARVVSGYEDALGYFLKPSQKAFSPFRTSQFADADYVLLYLNQWQRGIPSPDVVRYYLDREPAHIVRSGGLELARIYDVRNVALPESLRIVTTSAANYGDRMRLAGYRLEPPANPTGPTGAGGLSPGDHTLVTLYLRRLTDTDTPYNMLCVLLRPMAPRSGATR